MTGLIRHRVTILLLVLYWPVLFVSSHIPVPQWVRDAGVSDKVLHFLAYLILTFLLWFSVCPRGLVNWKKRTVWLVLAAAAFYGIVDELTQGLVGRSTDIRDFAADSAGIIAGVAVFSFVSFRPAALVVTGAAIFGLTNLARTNLSDLLPVANAVFHLVAHGLFALLWVWNMRHLVRAGPATGRWFAAALALPAGLVATVKLFSVILNRHFSTTDMVFALAAIVCVVVSASIAARWLGRRGPDPQTAQSGANAS